MLAEGRGRHNPWPAAMRHQDFVFGSETIRPDAFDDGKLAARSLPRATAPPSVHVVEDPTAEPSAWEKWARQGFHHPSSSTGDSERGPSNSLSQYLRRAAAPVASRLNLAFVAL
jgi:hypothetical protein